MLDLISVYSNTQFFIEIRDFNRNYLVRDFASNLINTQFRFNFIQNLQLYSITKLFNNKMFQDIQGYYKPLHYLIISLVAYLNWVVLNGPWGTFFWLRTKIACPPAPPQPRLIVHRHLRILLFTKTITTLFEFTLSLIRSFFDFF